MIDGTQFNFQTSNPETYLLELPGWEALINKETGHRVNDSYTRNLRGLDMELKPRAGGGHILLVNGSLHKFHNCGEHNADQFTFAKLLQSTSSLTDAIGLDAARCSIHGLEVGVNITLPYSPLKVFRNMVCYRSRPFTQISKRCAAMGLQCALSQYTVKAYNKSRQSNIDCGNVLRFEVHVSKMQFIKKYGIYTLADLQNIEKVYPLINVLKDAVEGIIWTDLGFNICKLSDREQKQWLRYSNPKTWQGLSMDKRYRAVKTWCNLLQTYGKPPDLLPLITETWESLFLDEIQAEKPRCFYHAISKNKAGKTAMFLPLVCTVKTSLLNNEKSIRMNTSFEITESSNTYRERRYCLSCGRDISRQRKRSYYCSESLYGKMGKRCRNNRSNRMQNMKNIISKAVNQNVYLLITYADANGLMYSDILHPSELHITHKWFDNIKSLSLTPNK